jgi:hypothetical protein
LFISSESTLYHCGFFVSVLDLIHLITYMHVSVDDSCLPVLVFEVPAIDDANQYINSSLILLVLQLLKHTKPVLQLPAQFYDQIEYRLDLGLEPSQEISLNNTLPFLTTALQVPQPWQPLAIPHLEKNTDCNHAMQ